ncbi:MAG: DUF1146 family protein [Bacilli bacterium]
MEQLLGIDALTRIIVHLFFIIITWYALMGVRIDKIIKPNHIWQARVFYIFITIAIGSAVSNFFLDYLISARSLYYLFS